jgi:MoxR-like ATPase
MMRKIINVHFENIDERLAENAINSFYRLREIEAIEKKPATRELLNWIRALNADPDFKAKDLIKEKMPFLGVLFKKSPDYERATSLTTRRKMF